MATITVENGKFSIYITDLPTGGSPVKPALEDQDGYPCVIKDKTEQVWVLRTHDSKLQYKKTNDFGNTWSPNWVDIDTERVCRRRPIADDLEANRISVTYWKTVEENGEDVRKWYRSYTDNFGETWTQEEITTE